MKYLQNRIAESASLLPLTAAVSVLLLFVGGMPTAGAWTSLLCFALSCYLMIELSNSNALLRVRSRMVTSTFIFLSAAADCLVGSVQAALAQLFCIIALLILFTTYQEDDSVGRTFYAFASLSVASVFFVPVLCYVPVIWILMATQLQSLSVRTWLASLFGLLTPYWLVGAWLLFQQDIGPLTAHFSELTHWSFTFNLSSVPSVASDQRASAAFTFSLSSLARMAAVLLTVALSLTGAIHFWTRSYEDKIRIRLLYGFFTTMTAFTTVFLVLQPQHYEPLMRLLLITASPLIAHFFTHTSSRITNILFIAVIILTFAIALAAQL